MRTTLDLDDDVLQAARELARQQHTSTGRIVSDLARQALVARASADAALAHNIPLAGFSAFPTTGHVVTQSAVDAVRDAEGI